ncbi:stage III sporulation protein AF [Paenibacillus beijingensis]|uniref:stage III sporulation protein AF n=1 Tax=Paenibacillus beijingensis TaxID=1126833 RepID=UPI0006986135|nr:stage III sporulation protein AF [Paenibacillus beijingensis]
MLEWLSGWLRDIIAIVLLAAIIDLLLPNKAMQRYVRLVVGLIILLTILTPIMRIFQGDLDKKVAEGFRNWDESSAMNEVKMPTLSDITKEAQRLSDERRQQTAELARANIETAIKKSVQDRLGAAVSSVKAQLAFDAAGEGTLQSVTVTLASSESAGNRGAEASGTEAVDPVTPVAVDVSVEAPDQPPQSPAGEADRTGNEADETAGEAIDTAAGIGAEGTERQQSAADKKADEAGSGALSPDQAALAAAIVDLVSKMWSIGPEQVRVTAA